MVMRSYLSSTAGQRQQTLKLDEGESWHLVHVLRARRGDEVSVFDGAGNEWCCTLETADSTRAVLDVHKHFKATRHAPWTCTLAQALPKGKVMDQLVRRATEIGTARILPLETQRTEVHLAGQREPYKIEKWRTASIEACKQSGNSFVPELAPLQRLDAWLKTLAVRKETALCVVASLEPPTVTLRAALKRFQEKNGSVPRAVTWLIGPEGDFTPEEYQMIRSSGFEAISLGKHILRVETAAVYALSILDYEANLISSA